MCQHFLAIKSVEIPVRSLRPSIEWYCTVLDAEAVRVYTNSAVIRSRYFAQPYLFLVETVVQYRLHFSQPNGQLHAVLNFLTSDLEQCYERITNLGVNTTKLSWDDDEPVEFMFCDPDGNWFGVGAE